MRKRADEIIGVILEVYRVAATRNGLLAKPVDRGLNTHVGYGKHNALQPRGNTDSEYPFQVFEAEFGLLAPHAKHVVFHNKHDNEHGANDVGNYGSERNARDAHVARRDKQKVKPDVEHTRYQKRYKRAFGVAHAPQNSRAEIEHH